MPVWITKKLSRLKIFFPSKTPEKTEKKRVYQTLLPVKDPEQYKNYKDAFDTILDEPVMCVAVTGSYGAGKSSLIKAFEEQNKNKYKFKTISLATFGQGRSSSKEQKLDSDEGNNSNDNSKEQEQENTDLKKASNTIFSSNNIQKGILQQLIYSQKPNDLPYSRFKKIRKPQYSWLKSIVVTLFGLTSVSAFTYWDYVEQTHIPYLKESGDIGAWIGSGLTLLVWLGLLTWILVMIHQMSSGLSLRKISLKNAEIETGDKSSDSVFNRHMDELIYFFQETDVDIVIVEDLDRFKNTQIFEKLREICLLINSNEAIKEKRRKVGGIKFVFAVRDDLFEGKDRTKFFDFIIPVIPYVSSSNSYDILHNRLEKIGVREEMDTSFLHDISLYINDNRHLVNTVNEFVLYHKNLLDDESKDAHETDPQRLFAMMLYKNCYPEDFEKLHNLEGVFATILQAQEENKQKHKEVINTQLEELNNLEKRHQQASIQNRGALAYAYLGVISRTINGELTGVEGVDGLVDLTEDTEELYSAIIYNEQIRGNTKRNNYNYDENFITKTQLAEQVHPGFTLEEKRKQIDAVETTGIKSIDSQRESMKSAMQDIPLLKLHECLTVEEVQRVAQEAMGKSKDLFAYLVTNGHIGEDYHQYVSYFHKGAISQADNNFMRNFHTGNTLMDTYSIDHPNEIIVRMGDRIFSKPQGLNVQIFDHLLRQENTDSSWIDQFIKGSKKHIPESMSFLATYYKSGQQVEKLLSYLIQGWEDFIDIAVQSEESNAHTKKILLNLAEDSLPSLDTITIFKGILTTCADEIFVDEPLINKIPLLQNLGVKIDKIDFPDLDAKSREKAIDHIINKHLYRINAHNMITILEHYGVATLLAKKENYSQILLLKEAPFHWFVHSNINIYIKNCFLQLEDSVNETADSIEALLSAEGILNPARKELIKRQNVLLNFKNVPSACWNVIIEQAKYVVSWSNLNHFAQHCDEVSDLASVFETPDVVKILATKGEDISEELYGYVVCSNHLSDETYKLIVKPELGEPEELPDDLSIAKKKHFIDAGMTKLDESAVDWLEEDPSLTVSLIKHMGDRFFKNPDLIELDWDIRYRLLGEDFTQEQKFILCSLIEIEDLNTESAFIDLIEPLFVAKEFPLEKIVEDDVVKYVIRHAKEIENSVKLLTSKIADFTELEITDLLEDLPDPYVRIAKGGKRPTIPNTSLNKELIQKLKEIDYIKSFQLTKKGIRVIADDA